METARERNLEWENDPRWQDEAGPARGGQDGAWARPGRRLMVPVATGGPVAAGTRAGAGVLAWPACSSRAPRSLCRRWPRQRDGMGPTGRSLPPGVVSPISPIQLGLTSWPGYADRRPELYQYTVGGAFCPFCR